MKIHFPLKNTFLILIFLSFRTFLPSLTYGESQIPEPVSKRMNQESTILPADVYARLTWVQQELELIRKKLDKPAIPHLNVKISEAAPREVYFQALTLLKKANRFCFEQTRLIVDAPILPEIKTIKPFHVFGIVNQAFGRVLVIKNNLGIRETSQEREADIDTTPSQVFQLMVEVNRDLNNLLLEEFAPKDVFEQVTLAIGYTSRLLSKFPRIKRIPDYSPKLAKRIPRDVYHHLFKCYGIVKEISKGSDLNILDLALNLGGNDRVIPSDVYDMASLLVSELTYFYNLLEIEEPVLDSYDPGPKTPTDVYYRVELLYQQLEFLKAQIKNNPQWIKDSQNKN